MARLIAVVCLVALLAGPGRADGECPSAEEAMETLRSVDLAQGARTARFGVDPPIQLYEKAVHDVGIPQMKRYDKRNVGVIVVELPIRTLWKAVNDEAHHGEYMPVQHSEVISGTARGKTRELFQYYTRMGVGRWWVSRVWMNESLFDRSEGRLWELVWVDRMQEVDPTKTPFDSVSSKMTAIRSSEGAWILFALGEKCTSVEYYTRSEPGGVVGALQPLLAKRALRDILEGIVRLADEHVETPHPNATFVAPDGQVLD